MNAANRFAESRNRADSVIFPDDIIKALLTRVGDKFRKDPAVIHSALFSLVSDYGEFLEEFEFDESGITPYSEMLDRVLFRLETTGYIGAVNPSYEQYVVDSGKRTGLLRSLQRFSSEQQARLQEMGQRFADLVRAQEHT